MFSIRVSTILIVDPGGRLRRRPAQPSAAAQPWAVVRQSARAECSEPRRPCRSRRAPDHRARDPGLLDAAASRSATSRPTRCGRRSALPALRPAGRRRDTPCPARRAGSRRCRHDARVLRLGRGAVRRRRLGGSGRICWRNGRGCGDVSGRNGGGRGRLCSRRRHYRLWRRYGGGRHNSGGEYSRLNRHGRRQVRDQLLAARAEHFGQLRGRLDLVPCRVPMKDRILQARRAIVRDSPD